MVRKISILLVASLVFFSFVNAGLVAAEKEKLTIALVSEPTTLDPHKQWNPSSYYVYRNIFDNMVTRNSDGKIVPQVAESWNYIDQKTIDFKIRTNIKFHDGSSLTVDDVVFSVKRVIDPKFKSPQAGQFNTITDAKKINKNTVRLFTKVPYPVLLAQLVKLSIVPKAYINKVGNDGLNRNPVGSGPYKFVAWKKGVSVKLEANNQYWSGQPPFPNVEFLAIPEKSTRIAMLQTKKADLVVSLDSDIALQLKNSSTIKVLSAPTERVAYFRINTLSGPTADLRVRKAIAYAIDRDLLVDGLKGGYSQKANVMVADTSFGFDPSFKSYAFNPEKAKVLLKEAGLGDTPINIYTAPAVFDQRVVEAIQQMLKDVGINAKIVGMDMGAFLKRMQGSAADKDMTSFGRWSCACQDADGILYSMLHSSSIWSNIKNAGLDQLLDSARSSLDSKTRLNFYNAAHQIIENELPLLPLYQVGIIYAGNKNLNWRPTANESLFIMDMSWK
ncbi:MAG: peptide ABC transporter [Deltaproteobacteria bacterium]|nr:peptide ABC transporter [Deltaproteobacteria bacterium]